MTGCEFFGGKTESINSVLAKDFPHCDPGLLHEMVVGAMGYCLSVWCSVHTSLITYSHFLIFIYLLFVNFLAAVTRSIIVTIFLVRIFQYVKGILRLVRQWF